MRHLLFSLVHVGIDVTVRRVVITITWFHQSKLNANFPIIFDVIYNHIEFILFIYFYPFSRFINCLRDF